MTRGLAWMLVGLVFVCVIAAFVSLSVSAGRGGETMPLYSNRRFDPYGSAALYRLMARRAERVVSLERPALSEAHSGVMVQVLPLNHGVVGFEFDGDEIVGSPYDLPTSKLLDWVAAGNTLVQLTRGHTEVMQALGVMPEDAETLNDLGSLPLRQQVEDHQRRGGFPDDLPGWNEVATWGVTERGEHAVSLSLHEPRFFSESGPQDWRPLLWSGKRVLGGEVAHGKGRVILIGAPTPALNYGLEQADNAAWITGILAGDTVVFDEWSHGVGHSGTLIEALAFFGLVPVLLQVGVWLVCFRWSAAGGRMGREPSVVRRRSSTEHIETLGRLYDRAWDMPEKRRRVYDELVTRLSTACRCNADELRAHLKQRGDDVAGRTLELLDRTRAMAMVSRPTCAKCGYELSSTTRDHCPECGELVPRRVRRLAKRRELLETTAAPDKKRWSENDLGRILDESLPLMQELKRV